MSATRTPTREELKNHMRARNSQESVIYTASVNSSEDNGNNNSNNNIHTIVDTKRVTRPALITFKNNPLWTDNQRERNSKIFKFIGSYSKFDKYLDHNNVQYCILGDIQYNIVTPNEEKVALIPMHIYMHPAAWVQDIEVWLAAQKVEILDMTPHLTFDNFMNQIVMEWR
jgi:hypothetical protein